MKSPKSPGSPKNLKKDTIYRMIHTRQKYEVISKCIDSGPNLEMYDIFVGDPDVTTGHWTTTVNIFWNIFENVEEVSKEDNPEYFL